MEAILCFPDPPSPELHKALEASGYSWAAASDVGSALRAEPTDGYTAAVVSAVDSHEGAFAFIHLLRERHSTAFPILLVIAKSALHTLDPHRELFDDFTLESALQDELAARLFRLLQRSARKGPAELIVYGPLALNLETYQAVVDGRPLDLTYMEYELLRYLAANPGKVFTREALLSAVWGYDYFGGARTVDVHVRRLRAKLGEENAHLIETVRSVGYRFGTSRWAP